MEDLSTYDLLREIVAETKCKPGWSFAIRTGEGALRLVITVEGVDSWDPEVPRMTGHWFPVPPATYKREAWQRWIFECCRGVENHEDWCHSIYLMDPNGLQLEFCYVCRPLTADDARPQVRFKVSREGRKVPLTAES